MATKKRLTLALKAPEQEADGGGVKALPAGTGGEGENLSEVIGARDYQLFVYNNISLCKIFAVLIFIVVGRILHSWPPFFLFMIS